MPAPDQQPFFERVLEVVAQIPEGKVTTYGHIARYLGKGHAARTVGWALKGAGPYLPCHRVVNRDGALTGRLRFESPFAMQERLRCEGIRLDSKGCVDLSTHLWDPASGLLEP